MAVESYVELMQHDKKVKNGRLRLVLLRSLGQAVVSDNVPLAEVESAIRARSAHD
jgi:3-dehydroquinate synthase